MVCLYGPTLDILAKTLTKKELNEYPIWNWLIFRLNKFIYSIENKKHKRQGAKLPPLPSYEDESLYGSWFWLMVEMCQLFDETLCEKTVYEYLINPPTEIIASRIYDSTPLDIQKNFINEISLYILPISVDSTNDTPQMPPQPENPADYKAMGINFTGRYTSASILARLPSFKYNHHESESESESEDDDYSCTESLPESMPDLEPVQLTFQGDMAEKITKNTKIAEWGNIHKPMGFYV